MREIFKQAIKLFLVCIVVAITLAFTYSVTKEKIDDRARKDAEAARKEVLVNAETFENISSIGELAKKNPVLSIVKEGYRGIRANKLEGYVFSVVTKGYGGPIQITVGIDTNGKIVGVKIGQHTETPGLGTKAAEKPFKSQLVDIIPNTSLKVIKGKKSKPEEVEAISGATITSEAVVKAVQAAVDMSKELQGGGSNK